MVEEKEGVEMGRGKDEEEREEEGSGGGGFTFVLQGTLLMSKGHYKNALVSYDKVCRKGGVGKGTTILARERIGRD